MVRTTINLDPTVLGELRERARADGKSMGEVASVLLARALHEASEEEPPFEWQSADLGVARVDVDNRDELWAFFDRETFAAAPPTG